MGRKMANPKGNIEPEPNLEKLSPSRKEIREGDIFVLRPKGHDFYFGRVIKIGTKVGRLPENEVRDFDRLIYIYNTHSPKKLPVPELHVTNLLFRPLVVNNTGWSRGYFEVVEHRELTPEDVLKVHCFEDEGRYLDEMGRELPRRFEPCGYWGIGSFRTVDAVLSNALGIPKAPDWFQPGR